MVWTQSMVAGPCLGRLFQKRLWVRGTSLIAVSDFGFAWLFEPGYRRYPVKLCLESVVQSSCVIRGVSGCTNVWWEQGNKYETGSFNTKPHTQPKSNNNNNTAAPCHSPSFQVDQQLIYIRLLFLCSSSSASPDVGNILPVPATLLNPSKVTHANNAGMLPYLVT